ncbi:MAG: hypothetical protein LBI18_12720 [Planctomycetaceae bacterium]|jgi:hypothetical protein|nr:hypothetical protein [Planctomycetaceae bacterium]
MIDSNHPKNDLEAYRVSIIEEFKNGINNCLEKIETNYKEEIKKKLMTPKFRNFKKEQLLVLSSIDEPDRSIKVKYFVKGNV